MKFLSEHINLVALSFFLLMCGNSIAKDGPLIEAIVSSDSISLELSYQLCGGCDESFDKLVCDFSGDICTELLAPLEVNYNYLSCLKERSGAELTEASIKDVAKLADYLFRGGKELTCDDIDFLSASQILDGVTVVTLTDLISDLFERAETAAAVR